MRRLAALAAVLVCGAAGCGGEGAAATGPDGTSARGTSAPEPASPEGQLTALLERRAKALQAGSARRLAATATGAQRARDRTEARNARGLPLRDVGSSRATSTSPAPAPCSTSAPATGSPASAAASRPSARCARGAPRTAGGSPRARAAARGCRGRSPATPPAARSHFTILAPAALATGGLDDALEGGYARMRDVLVKGVLRRRYLVVVAGSPADARRMTTGIRGVATLAAISDSAVREEGPADRVVQVASQRLLVVWPPFATLDADGRARVVTHELTHAALAGHTSGRTPGWLLEGIALYVSGDRRVGAAARYVAGDAGRVSAPRADAHRPLGARRDRPARRRGPVRRLRLQLRGGLLHRRALRPQALPAALRRLQRPRAERAGGRRADRRGRAPHARDPAAGARARPAPLDRHARGRRPVRALSV